MPRIRVMGLILLLAAYHGSDVQPRHRHAPLQALGSKLPPHFPRDFLIRSVRDTRLQPQIRESPYFFLHQGSRPSSSFPQPSKAIHPHDFLRVDSMQAQMIPLLHKVVLNRATPKREVRELPPQSAVPLEQIAQRAKVREPLIPKMISSVWAESPHDLGHTNRFHEPNKLKTHLLS